MACKLCCSLDVKQYFAATSALLLHLSLGICQGYSAILLPQIDIRNNNLTVSSRKYIPTLSITTEEASWIASISVIAMPVGSLTVGVLMEIYGRKKCIQISYIPLTLGWSLIAYSDSVMLLCTGRLITGFAIGMDPAVIIYIAETIKPKYRSVFLSLAGPTVIAGILLTYLLGYYLLWSNVATIIACFSGLCFFLLFLIPESPVWLISKDQIKEAKESLTWLRNDVSEIDAEMDVLLQAKISYLKNDEQSSYFKRILRPSSWKPFLILTAFFFLQQTAGYNVITYYAVTFFDTLETKCDSYMLSFVFIILSLLSSILCSAIIERFNRKTLALLSALGTSLIYIIVAIYEYEYENVQHKPLVWLPIVGVWLGVIVGMLGINPLPWVMAGELFPTDVRGVLTGLLWVTVYFYIFLNVKMYLLFLPVIKTYGIFLIFSVSSFLIVIFSALYLPETRGKTLIEIESTWLKSN